MDGGAGRREPGPSVSYVSLGDSSAVGVGASRGGGYPERLASRLRQDGLAVGLTNLGMSGAVIRDVAVARAHGVHVVDLYSASREFIPLRPDFFCWDGFHPSDAGYEQWADLMLPAVRPLVARC